MRELTVDMVVDIVGWSKAACDETEQGRCGRDVKEECAAPG